MCKSNASLFPALGRPLVAKAGAARGESRWSPNTDVYVTDDSLVIKVELAGMRREDLTLTIDGRRLLISGQRPDGCRAARCKFIVMEIEYGPFESVIEVPAGYDLDRARAVYQNGFLRVDVPRHSPVSKKPAKAGAAMA